MAHQPTPDEAQSPTTGFRAVRQEAAEEVRDADASLVVGTQDGGDTHDVHAVVSPDYTDAERERITRELVKSITHFIGRQMNPLAAMVGGAPEPDYDALDVSDTVEDGDEASDYLASADGAVVVILRDADEQVQWDDEDGAAYGGGQFARDEDKQEIGTGCLDHARERFSRTPEPSGGPSGGPTGLPF